MKRTRLVYLAICLASALWTGCSSSPQASTEVENEIVLARSVTGVAMDSVALDSAAWTVWSSTGTLLASGTTDSAGQFVSSAFPTATASLLVRVVKAQDTLRSLLLISSGNTKDSTASVLVHALTEAAVERILPQTQQTQFSLEQAQSARSAGQYLLQYSIGLQVSWDSLQGNRLFRPQVVSNQPVPPATAALLQALSVRSGRDKKRLGNWLQNREQGAPVFRDSLFIQDLYDALDRSDLDSSSQQQYLEELEHVGPANTNLQDGWRKHRNPPPPPPPPPGGQDSTKAPVSSRSMPRMPGYGY